jgi:hypothetical protein
MGMILMILISIIGILGGGYFGYQLISKIFIDSAIRNLGLPNFIGWNWKFGSYVLLSFDNRKNWYAVKIYKGTITPIGAADEIFPGLLASLIPEK